MTVRLWSLLVWALVGAGAVFWALKLGAQPQAVPAQAPVAQPQDHLRGDLTRLLGAGPAPGPQAGVAPAADAGAADPRFTLVGVISPPGPLSTEDAVALISVDGKPPRAYRVGDVVDGERVLQSVSQRKATLGPAGQPQQVLLAIPEPPEAQRGAPAFQGALPGSDDVPVQR